MASMAALSAVQELAMSLKSWMKARWMTPSEASAPRRRLSRSLRSPVRGMPPAAVMIEALDSFRARPITEWPCKRSSFMVAWPMKPAAPVTKTRMVCFVG